jgi:hypothetical protein
VKGLHFWPGWLWCWWSWRIILNFITFLITYIDSCWESLRILYAPASGWHSGAFAPNACIIRVAIIFRAMLLFALVRGLSDLLEWIGGGEESLGWLLDLLLLDFV